MNAQHQQQRQRPPLRNHDATLSAPPTGVQNVQTGAASHHSATPASLAPSGAITSSNTPVSHQACQQGPIAAAADQFVCSAGAQMACFAAAASSNKRCTPNERCAPVAADAGRRSLESLNSLSSSEPPISTDNSAAGAHHALASAQRPSLGLVSLPPAMATLAPEVVVLSASNTNRPQQQQQQQQQSGLYEQRTPTFVTNQPQLKLTARDTKLNQNGAPSVPNPRDRSIAVAEVAPPPPPPPPPSTRPKPPFMFAGIVGCIMSSVFFSTSVLCVKLLPNQQEMSEKTKAICLRGLTIMLLCGVTIVVSKGTFVVRRGEIWVNILRCLFGFLGAWGAYVSLTYITMGESTALVFSSPVWTSILSYFVLGESLHWILIIAIPASCVGIVLIAQPALLLTGLGLNLNLNPNLQLGLEGDDALDAPIESAPLINTTTATTTATIGRLLDNHAHAYDDYSTAATDAADRRWIGISVALATSLIVSCVYIVLKFRKTTPIQTTTFWLGFANFFCALLIMCFSGFGELPCTQREWWLLVLNGVCSWLGQCLLQWSISYENASVLSVMRTLDVAFTFALTAIFLDDQILWTSLLGAAIISLVVVSLVLNNWIQSLISSNQANRLRKLSIVAHQDSGAAKCPSRLESANASTRAANKSRAQLYDSEHTQVAIAMPPAVVSPGSRKAVASTIITNGAESVRTSAMPSPMPSVAA